MLEALEATGHREEAQRRRWAEFERARCRSRFCAVISRTCRTSTTSRPKIRPRRSPGAFRNSIALWRSWSRWPDLSTASRLVLTRAGEINGADDTLMAEAARRLEGAIHWPPPCCCAPRSSTSPSDLWRRATSLRGGGASTAGGGIAVGHDL
ncbi:DUF6880 family protein [Caulobacter segnis]